MVGGGDGGNPAPVKLQEDGLGQAAPSSGSVLVPSSSMSTREREVA